MTKEMEKVLVVHRRALGRGSPHKAGLEVKREQKCLYAECFKVCRERYSLYSPVTEQNNNAEANDYLPLHMRIF